MNILSGNIRIALRQMRKNPGFAITTVLCLGIGIGANTAIFDISNTILFPSSEISDPGRVVRIYTRWDTGEQYSSFSYPDYIDVRDRIEAFESAATEAISPFNFAVGDVAERTWGQMVSGNYFSTLGIDMELGRSFTPEEDDEPGRYPVLIISHGLWKRRFGSDPGVIGSDVILNGHSFSVIGVVEEGFRSGMIGLVTDLYVPMAMHEQAMPGMTWMDQRGSHWLQDVVARLKDGVTIEQASAEIEALMTNLGETYPDDNAGKSAVVLPEGKSSLHPMVRPQFQAVMVMLFVVVGLLLLLTCANVAGLLLARAMARRKEMGVRLALGADRFQLVRQILTESILLALLAGFVGILLAQLLVPLTQSAQPQMDIPLQFDTSFDWSTVWFTPLISLITGVVFGLIPALEVSGGDLVSALRTGRATVEKRTHRLRGVLVGGQVALSMALLISAGLVLRSAQAVQNIYPGFEPGGQIVATIDLDLQGYDEERGRIFHRELERRLLKLPGVDRVGLAALVPLSLSSWSIWVWPEGWESPTEAQSSVNTNVVSPGYFEVMGINIVQGRGFVEEDNDDSAPVMVINAAFAEKFWPGEDPLGRIVRLGGQDGTAYEVIGMVPTGRWFSIGEDPAPFFYRTFNHVYIGSMTLHVRGGGDPHSLFTPVRQVIRDLDPALPISRMQTMDDQMDFALLPSRLIAWSVTAFAILALLLTSIGLYGLIAYSVNRETREIGIRMALGAQPGHLLVHVVRRGMLMTLTGVIIGLLVGLAGSRGISGVLYGLSPIEPIATGVALIIILITAFMASWLPARRATSVDPVRALRAE